MGQVIKPDRKNSDLFPNSLQSLISSKLGQPGRAGVVSRQRSSPGAQGRSASRWLLLTVGSHRRSTLPNRGRGYRGGHPVGATIKSPPGPPMALFIAAKAAGQ